MPDPLPAAEFLHPAVLDAFERAAAKLAPVPVHLADALSQFAEQAAPALKQVVEAARPITGERGQT